ncbi:uncharacterized protein LOC129966600 [Argiope bruennichi]|uniref:uncharacterized protein LOC129966600 n=1 Tax=Argiope bruennichi TaxID=94029 RepID=UPI0024957DB3|nr:uncharacterized protein LOC129966600 [Argiope bruennichi]
MWATMNFNITMQDVSCEPFFNVSQKYLLLWSFLNIMKCVYVGMSIKKKRLPRLVVATLFTGLTVIYFVETRAFTWLLVLQILDLLMIVYIILTRRNNRLLIGLLILSIFFLTPFGFVIDVIVIVFMIIDFPAIIFENSPFWLLMYANCLAVSVAIASMNSFGPAPYKLLVNSLYICFFYILSWNSADVVKVLPVFMTITTYILKQFNRDEPMRLDAPGFIEISTDFLPLHFI